MIKFNRTKHALLMSVIALFLCISMLVGGTYAWYTYGVITKDNIIKSGTLNVSMKWADGTKDVPANDSAQWTDASAGAIFESDNWEPGETRIAYLKVKNEGDLALKCAIDLDVQNISKDLYKVLQYDITYLGEQLGESVSWDGEGNNIVVGFQSIFEEEYLLPGEVRYFALAIHMDDDASNEYQGGEVRFDLILLTTQNTVEYDGISNEYDNDAYYIYHVKNSEELKRTLVSTKKRSIVCLAPGTYDGLSFDNLLNYTAKNITFMGTRDVIIDGFTINDGDGVATDIEIDGLTFRNITFTDSLLLSTTVMKNVTVEDCDFINDAFIKQNDPANPEEKLTNLVVKNCNFTGADGEDKKRTAIVLVNIENLTVTGCTFTNIEFNALQLAAITGTILFDNNIVNGTGSRALRFANPQNGANITVSNNTIITKGDPSTGELAKGTYPLTITLINNTWNGLTDAQVADKLKNIN